MNTALSSKKALREAHELPVVKRLRVQLEKLRIAADDKAEEAFSQDRNYWHHYHLGRKEVFELAIELLNKAPVSARSPMDNAALQFAALHEIGTALAAYRDQASHNADMVFDVAAKAVARGVAAACSAVFVLLDGGAAA